MPTTFLDCVEADRLLKILYETALPDTAESAEADVTLAATIRDHIDHFLAFHDVAPEATADAYTGFLGDYSKDLKAFRETGSYPLALNEKREAPPTLAYHIALLFSTLCYAPRFDIMRLFKQSVVPAKRAVFVGCGPGLELTLSKGTFEQVDAFDPGLDGFLPSLFADVSFHTDYFDSTSGILCDAFVMIELLEHLEDPYALLAECANVANEGARVYLTTATDIPQFDHLYNFPRDHADFEQKVRDLGFGVELKKDVPHAFKKSDVSALNTYYVLIKK